MDVFSEIRCDVHSLLCSPLWLLLCFRFANSVYLGSFRHLHAENDLSVRLICYLSSELSHCFFPWLFTFLFFLCHG